ncbi:glycine betaine ABC transporter substrate-binding protein [Shouchella shacheensis]|uniref:glycine betaine ABC transporter substrate-binding protein n=1 Tax=Shouchella shacheensis TaxID=1649580 RepID=UPI00073FF388|nr:glycine betaine ABC transporter substrate-binding protein [Shouchella shacheensis]
MKKILMRSTAIAIGTTALVACGNGDTDENGSEESGSGEITIGHTTYTEATAFAHVWAQLLEEQGYDVTLSTFEKAFIFEGVASDDVDVGFVAWLPFTDDAYIQLDSDHIQEEAVLYEDATMGLVVPTYMEDVNTIEDLQNYHEELDGTITGMDPGASQMELTEDEVMPHYGLDDFTLSASSETAMMEQLNTAYQNEDPIAVTLWSPHWAFGEYELKYLEDPDTMYGEPDDIYYMARTGLAEEEPELVEWMNNSFFDDETLSELLTLQEELDSAEDAAAEWIEDNRDLIDSWME